MFVAGGVLGSGEHRRESGDLLILAKEYLEIFPRSGHVNGESLLGWRDERLTEFAHLSSRICSSVVSYGSKQCRILPPWCIDWGRKRREKFRQHRARLT